MADPLFTVALKGDTALIQKFSYMPAEVRAALRAKIQQLALMLQRKVQEDHLSGPTGEHTLSVGENTKGHTGGALRRSVFERVDETDMSIIGVVGFGADVVYAAIHEFGGTINHPGGTAYFLDADGRAAFVSNDDARAAYLPRTKPHSITIPERAPLRTSLQEMADIIKAELAEAVATALVL